MNETPNHLLALNDPAPNHAGNSILARGCRGQATTYAEHDNYAIGTARASTVARPTA